MPKELRGRRYVRTVNHDTLVRFIQDELFYLDFKDTCDWYVNFGANLDPNGKALLGCNDRYYLFTGLLGRKDGLHPWLFDRFREVEDKPDGFIDLWSRFHYKSSAITFAGAIQEVVCNPEIKIAIFSVVKPIAQAFLSQIKDEFESNETLKKVYHDVLFDNPRQLGSDGKPTKWGLARGITVKRDSRPKEATIEAHGLIDGQPTSRHYDLHIYDDVVTQDHLSPESIKKTTARWEMADNLGSHLGCRKWCVGTRYHQADTYGVIISRKSLKPRIYPATDNGEMNGQPVFLTPQRWEEIKRDQRSTVSAQCLLNPIAGNEATFKPHWLRTYDIIPAVMNVYILIDPSKGSGERSDRTAIAVIGIDVAGNKYLLDGVRHRMKLSERWATVKALKLKWETHPGVQMLRVGWERYGMNVELEVIEDMQLREQNIFPIEELNTPRQGGHSKNDRIERLEPDVRLGRFFLPCEAYSPDHGGLCYWFPWTEQAAAAAADNPKTKHEAYTIGQIVYRPKLGPTKRQRQFAENPARIVSALRRRDENGAVYDLTRAFIEEAMLHPFATHDDLIDAVSRIYDIEPMPPVAFEARATEPIGVEAFAIETETDGDES